MTVVLLVIVVLVLLVVVGGAGFALALARSSKKTMAANASIPGVDVAVPDSWGGSHDPEARLHRRIRDAVAALDATIGSVGVAQIDDRARLMVSAQELDQRLVSIWVLPRESKSGPLADVEKGVTALESGVSAVVLEPSDGAVGRARDAVDSVGQYAPPPVAPPVPDVTPPQAAEPADRQEPPSSLAE